MNDCRKDLRFFRHCETFFKYNFHWVKEYPLHLMFRPEKKRLASVD